MSKCFPSPILDIQNQDGSVEEFKTTDQHPFYVDGKGWINAGDLETGDKVLTPTGQTATIVNTRFESHPEGLTVYNFEVEGPHTYFVLDGQGLETTPIWVHNTKYKCNVSGSVRVPARLIFGTTKFGDFMHQRIAKQLIAIFKKSGINIDVTNALLKKNGIDIQILKDGWRRIGFKYADIKPLSASGFKSLEKQIANWNKRATIRAIVYDAHGNWTFW